MSEQLKFVLQQALHWHQGESWRNGTKVQRDAWEAHRDALQEAIAALSTHHAAPGAPQQKKWAMCTETETPCSVCPTTGAPCAAAAQQEASGVHWCALEHGGVFCKECDLKVIESSRAAATAPAGGVTPTAAEVVDYCARHGVSPAKAKEALTTTEQAAEPVVDPIQAAADASSVGHLSALLDHQTQLLGRAMAAMKAIADAASPADEGQGDFTAEVPYETWAAFVDARASLLHDVAQSPVADQEARAAEPEGWKLVPIEPTPEMTKAAGETPGMKAIDSASTTHQLRGYPLPESAFKEGPAIVQAYRAMLAASPQSPTGTEKKDAEPVVHQGMTIAGDGAAMLGRLMREQRASRLGVYPDGNPNAGTEKP